MAANTQITTPSLAEWGADCPSADELAAFSSGRITVSRQDAIFAHVSHCQHCEESLGRLSEGGVPSALPLRGADSNWTFGDESGCHRLQRAAADMVRQMDRPESVARHESTNSSRFSTDVDPQFTGASGLSSTETFNLSPVAIGRYRIRSVLGTGAFGQVYLADDDELDRQVALKVPKFSAGTSPQTIDAFLQEARTAARLKHPGIVTIYEVGADLEVGCFIAMEYVEGGSLRQRMTSGRVPAEQAAKFVAQVAEAVHYAHKQGLVHRDLKPANLLIDGDGRLKVADFGLALAEEQQWQHAGDSAGTPAYMSPEQLRGEAHRLDGRSDVWSLGVILYELLTNRRPFQGDREQVADDILHRNPKPPRQIEDTIPQRLEAICLRCLERDAGNRYSTARDLADELSTWAGTRLPSPHWKRSRYAVVAAAAVLLAVVGLLFLPGQRALWLGAPPRNDAPPPARSAPLPYDVDTVAEKFVPLPLLQGTPRELFPRNHPAEHWDFSAPEQRLSIDTPSVFLVGLGQTNCSSFNLDVEITKNESSGEAGIIFGIKPQDGASDCWRFEIIVIRCYDPQHYYVQRDAGELRLRSGGQYSVERTGIAGVEVPADRPDRAKLEVSIRDRRIKEIRWRGAALRELVGPPAPEAVDFGGQFGVIAKGSASFHEPRFTADVNPH